MLWEDDKDQRLTNEGLRVDNKLLEKLGEIYEELLEHYSVREIEYMIYCANSEVGVDTRLKLRYEGETNE